MRISRGQFAELISLLSILAGVAAAGVDEDSLDEQRLIADNAFALVLAECGVEIDASHVSLPEASFRFHEKALWQNRTFGEISATFSKDDLAYSRFHKSGQTIWQQLQGFPNVDMEGIWRERLNRWRAHEAGKPIDWSAVRAAKRGNQNVVVNYLLYHLLAFRFVKAAAEAENPAKSESLFRHALIYEACAQSYLRHAFSAGHMRLPLRYPFFVLHRRNTKTAHDFYRSTGMYVINSRGDVWETFGDEILQTHPPTYRFVLEASVTSLREVLLVYFVLADSQNPIVARLIDAPPSIRELREKVVKAWSSEPDGESYYRQLLLGYSVSTTDGKTTRRSVSPNTSVETIKETVQAWTASSSSTDYYADAQQRIPTLLLLPMPISATWSQRLDVTDQHGIHVRVNYPQLDEPGYYDSALPSRPLYPRASFPPDWQMPEELVEKGPDYLIKVHPAFASVHYAQERDLAPPYRGVLLQLGGSRLSERNNNGLGTVFGLGYGFFDELAILQSLPRFSKLSLAVSLSNEFADTRRTWVIPTIGIGVKLPTAWNQRLPTVPILGAVHLEGGYAWRVQDSSKANGGTLAVGIATQTVPLKFAYIGATFRLKGQWFWVEKQTLKGLVLEAVLH